MKILKKIVLVFICSSIVLAVAIRIYLLSTRPVYQGEQQLKNLQNETAVYFDDFGVPHIYAKNQKDAMTALGYVHAQDRLWQMELMRRIAPGRLSELFGAVMLKNDKFFSGLGIDEASEKAIATLDKNSETCQLTTAYLDGINQYIEKGKTPVEFRLLGITKQKLTIKDVFNIFGFMSFSFAMAPKTDPLLTTIRNQWGMEYLKDFGLDGSFATTRLKSYTAEAHDYVEIAKAVTALLDNSPAAPFIGSNSWVIGAAKTKNNKVIFANDPHIGFSQPGTWYEAHIVTPDYEMYGYYLAGTPFPLLGHNRNYAYGLTMFENDDIDLFLEEENPKNHNQYKTATGYKDYRFLTKTIKVKDTAHVVVKIKISEHGPVMSGLIDGLSNKKPVALSWIYTQHENKILDAVYALSHATSLDDFQKGVGLIHAPGLNIMYGDARNNIAWITAGKLYTMDKTVNPNFILNGANGVDDKKEFLDFKDNPAAINPPWNYVYSSNNQTEAINGYLYPGYYLPKDRAQRIERLLQPNNEWTKKGVSDMILDNTSSTAPEIVSNWLPTIAIASASANEQKAVAILKQWKGTNNLNDIAPTIYSKWVYFYLKNTFQDELGADNFITFLGTYIMKQTIGPQSSNEQSPWWDNVNSKNRKETRKAILSQSFRQAITLLEEQWGNDPGSWTWNKVNVLELNHPMGKVKALRGFFNVGPFEVPGGNEVINNMIFTYSDDTINEVRSGPSTRRIIDFSDVENSWSILPSGQSGNPMSRHYNDQTELYAQGKFRKMKLNKGEIIRTSTKLVLKPSL